MDFFTDNKPNGTLLRDVVVKYVYEDNSTPYFSITVNKTTE